MARIGRVGFELGAERGDEVVDGPQARIGVVAPDDIEEFLATNGFTGMRGEQPQNPGFLVG